MKNSKEKILGGYYLKARCIQNSVITKASPHTREIWDWLLKEANHKDSVVCKRGQTFRNYRQIIEGLSWYIGYRKMSYSKSQCENSMKWLKKAAMIATTKSTRGMMITILNYDYYQNPDNYKNNGENSASATTKAARKPQWCHTINKNKEKTINNNKNNLPSIEECSKQNKKKSLQEKNSEKNVFFSERQKSRAEIRFPAKDYSEVLISYQKLKGVQLRGSEFKPPRQTIKSLFMDGYTPSEIIGCFSQLAELSKIKPEIWGKWTINTARMKMPDFRAGILLVSEKIEENHIRNKNKKIGEAIKKCGLCRNGWIEKNGIMVQCACIKNLTEKT